MSVDRIIPGQAAAQQGINAGNRDFWNELCGTALAKSLGVTDSSPGSLAKFDAWYMEFYSYLPYHLPLAEMKGKRVLEVGLGYGTLAQQIAAAGADYTGLDIASGPVHMVRHRLSQAGLAGWVLEGNVLDCPFADASFEWLVAIGCFHHTGDLRRALDEARRVLAPGGRALVMVYSAYSYRRWLSYPRETMRYFLQDKCGQLPPKNPVTSRERADYDASHETGREAPETVFTSVGEMKRMTRWWANCRVERENIAQELVFRSWSRQWACRIAGPFVGLDLYCHLVK